MKWSGLSPNRACEGGISVLAEEVGKQLSESTEASFEVWQGKDSNYNISGIWMPVLELATSSTHSCQLTLFWRL